MIKITTSAPTTESQTFAERDATVLSPQLRALGNTYGAFEPRVKDMERSPRATITQYWEDGVFTFCLRIFFDLPERPSN